jgi:hypothetical protein
MPGKGELRRERRRSGVKELRGWRNSEERRAKERKRKEKRQRHLVNLTRLISIRSGTPCP